MNVTGLYHYPVKGLSAQPLKTVMLTPGEGFPFDRVFAIARHDSGYDPKNFEPLPKTRFIVLVREERLAALATHLDTASQLLEIHLKGDLVLSERLDTAAGRERVEKFFADMFNLGDAKRPTLAVGGAKRFTDISVNSEMMMNSISLINLATVRDLESKVGRDVDPLRFRANLYFDGLPPLAELDLPDRDVQIGQARLRVFRRTQRCAAIDVNPVTAVRDMGLPRDLMRQYGHADMGVYAEVLEGGSIGVGAQMSLV